MATLRVRYRTGDTDEWKLDEQMDLSKLSDGLHRTTLSNGSMSFGFLTREGHEEIDYGMAFIRMSEIVMWEIDGFLDEQRVISVWGLE